MGEGLLATASHALCDELDAAMGRIRHCVGQLDDAQVWHRSGDLNTVGNLILHLTGNVKQVIVSSVGGEPDDRDRPAEFAAREPIAKEELLRRLTEVVDRAMVVIRTATPEELARVRKLPSGEWTGMQAIVRSVAHFRGHTQEIIHMTRELLGSRYQFAGQR